MTTSDFAYLNKILAIMDACKVDFVLTLQSTWTNKDYDDNTNVKALMIKPFINANRDLIVNQQNKEKIINILAQHFDDKDYYHYEIRTGTKKIGRGFDQCEINFLHPDYFTLTYDHLTILGDSEIVFTKDEIQN